MTVKIITVDPGHRLSLQKHEHRGEMWQILDVPIDITVGDRQWLAQPGEMVWVPGGDPPDGHSGTRPGRRLEVAFATSRGRIEPEATRPRARPPPTRTVSSPRRHRDGPSSTGQPGVPQARAVAVSHRCRTP